MNYATNLANENTAQFDREVGGFLLAMPVLGASLAVAPAAAELYGYGTTGFYVAGGSAGSVVGVSSEYTKNLILNEQGTAGGYVSAGLFGAVGTTVSSVKPEASYITSLSNFTGISANRIASAGNGFLFGGAADFTRQMIDLSEGGPQSINGWSIVKEGLFGAAGGAAFPDQHGLDITLPPVAGQQAVSTGLDITAALATRRIHH